MLEDRRLLSAGLLAGLDLTAALMPPQVTGIQPPAQVAPATVPISPVAGSNHATSAGSLLGNLGLDVQTNLDVPLLGGSSSSGVSLGIDLTLGTANTGSTSANNSGSTTGLSLDISTPLLSAGASLGGTANGSLGIDLTLGAANTASTAANNSGSTTGLSLNVSTPLLSAGLSLGGTANGSTASSPGVSITLGSPVLSGPTGGSGGGLTINLPSGSGSVAPTSSPPSGGTTLAGNSGGTSPIVGPRAPVASSGSLGGDPSGAGLLPSTIESHAGASGTQGNASPVGTLSPLYGAGTTALPMSGVFPVTSPGAGDEILEVEARDAVFAGMIATAEQAAQGIQSGSGTGQFIAPVQLAGSLSAASAGVAALAPEGLGSNVPVSQTTPAGAEEEARAEETIALSEGESSGLLTNFQPGNLASLDGAFAALVEQLDQLGMQLGRVLQQHPWITWVVGMVGAAAVCEALHRRRRGLAVPDLTQGEDSTSIHWLPGLSDPSGS